MSTDASKWKRDEFGGSMDRASMDTTKNKEDRLLIEQIRRGFDRLPISEPDAQSLSRRMADEARTSPPRPGWWLSLARILFVVPVVRIVARSFLSRSKRDSRAAVLPSGVPVNPGEPGTGKSVEFVVKNTGRKGIAQAAVDR